MTNTLMENAAQAAFPDNAHGALVAAFREAFAMGWQAAMESLDTASPAAASDVEHGAARRRRTSTAGQCESTRLSGHRCDRDAGHDGAHVHEDANGFYGWGDA